jgi:uncharacterized protein (TIGR03437 family)
MRLALLAVGFSFCAGAQISDLAVSDDGQILLFRSAFRLQTENDVGTQGKIYRYQNGQWTRLAAAQDVGFAISPPDVFQPFLTSDSDVYGWQTNVGCILCQFVVVPPHSSQLNGVELPKGFPHSNLRISRNARYVVADSSPFGGPKYLDRTTGVITDAPGSPFGPPIRDIANDGAAVLLITPDSDPGEVYAPGVLSLWRPGSDPQPIYSESRIAAAALSANGGMVALETGSDGTQRKLLVLNTQTGERIRVATLASGVRGYFSLSNARWDSNGVNLLYLTPNGVNLWNAVTHETRVSTSSDEGFVSAALSADATIAWALTQNNRLLRIDVASGATQEVLPPLGNAPQVNSTGVPGSAIFLRGKGFTKDQYALDGTAVLPLVDATSDGYWVQIPWEYTSIPSGNRNVVLRVQNNPFETVAHVPFTPSLAPQFATIIEASGYPIVKAVHEDFGSLVTSDNPARTGETLHIYMTGLGPLDQPLATGQPGPSSPPAKPRAPVDCALGTTSVNVPFTAYAAGMIGIYQIDVTMPDTLPGGSPQLKCRVDGLLAAGSLPAGPTPPR